MLGAIIGDIVGTPYEFNNIKTKNFQFFGKNSECGDDTVMTVAVAEAIMNGGSTDDFIDTMRKWGRAIPGAGYGGMFSDWLYSDTREPYGSWGNGSAMRVAPCAQYVWTHADAADRLEDTLSQATELAKRSAQVTHNHPEGIKGAQAVAYSQILCYALGPDEAKQRIREDIPRLFNYNLSRTCDKIRPTYKFNESCLETVPEAIIAFLESTDFEDAIRNAISLGGDSDTLAAITGAIAEAAYGIPDELADKGLSYLPIQLREVYDRWCVECMLPLRAVTHNKELGMSDDELKTLLGAISDISRGSGLSDKAKKYLDGPVRVKYERWQAKRKSEQRENGTDAGRNAILSMPIAQDDWTARSYHGLRRAGINTIGDLVSKTEADVHNIRQLGTKSVAEIIAKLAELDLSLKGSDE